MKSSEWLAQATTKLKQADISSARLDCLMLLEDITGKDRSWLLAHPEQELTPEQVSKLDNQITRRGRHEPLAYIRGRSEFYGREFTVNAHTLQPRPETETMVELLLETASEKRQVKNVIDVGTGSGAIAITVKLERPELTVIATDISKNCLETAHENASNLKADIEFHQGNLLDPLLTSNFQPLAIILANLPYVPDSFQINQAAMHEPKLAIFGGQDGLNYYRELFTQIQDNDIHPAALLTESLPPQHLDLQKIALSHGYQLERTEDFIQVFIPQK